VAHKAEGQECMKAYLRMAPFYRLLCFGQTLRKLCHQPRLDPRSAFRRRQVRCTLKAGCARFRRWRTMLHSRAAIRRVRGSFPRCCVPGEFAALQADQRSVVRSLHTVGPVNIQTSALDFGVSRSTKHGLAYPRNISSARMFRGPRV
jgi:hypothetical protein